MKGIEGNRNKIELTIDYRQGVVRALTLSI